MSIPEQPFGFVAGRWVLSLADTPMDADRAPDYKPLHPGSVVFNNKLSHRVVADGSGTVGIVKTRIEARLNEDGKLIDAEEHEFVALPVGVYSVTFSFGQYSWPNFDIEVKAEHTIDSPLWLPSKSPVPAGPGVVHVVKEEDRIRAEAAALLAEGFSDSAEASALAASLASSERGVRIDNSVGTRVFLDHPGGSTMIYGDTGWRAISSWDETGTVTGLPLASASWEPTPGKAGGIFVRRNLDKVRIIVSSLTRTTATNAAVFADHTTNRIPVGFRPQNTETLIGLRSPTEFSTLALIPNGQMTRLSGGMAGANGGIDITAEVEARTEWPTELPGTPR